MWLFFRQKKKLGFVLCKNVYIKESEPFIISTFQKASNFSDYVFGTNQE